MKSKWNDGIGSRDRAPVAVLVTADGQPHRFTGKSIPGVCQSTQTDFTKNGKWSNSDFEILHHDTTAFVSWRQDWDTGKTWPQASWDEAYRFLATQAPALKPGLFDSFVRQHWPKTAARFDEVASAEVEFNKHVQPSGEAGLDGTTGSGPWTFYVVHPDGQGRGSVAPCFTTLKEAESKRDLLNREVKGHYVVALDAEFTYLPNKPATAEHLAAIGSAKAEIDRLNAEAKAAEELAEELARLTKEVRLARASRDRAAALAGLDPATLHDEADAICRATRQAENNLAAARRKAELGNSLGRAFDALSR
jgi:hypothetical protein